MNKIFFDDIPVAPVKLKRTNFVLWQNFEQKNLNQTFIRSLLDADYIWYKKSGADNFFNKWKEEQFDSNIGPFFDQRGDGEANEILAYYKPATWASDPSKYDDEKNFYGIHFDRKLMIQAAKRALGININSFGKINNGILIGIENEKHHWIHYWAFFQYILAHEFCHAWIEDLVCSIDPAKYNRAIITRDQTKKKRDHDQEEALCNTVGYGWMANFLDTTPLEYSVKETIKENILNWMRHCPSGYKNFNAIGCSPLFSSDLMNSDDGLNPYFSDSEQDRLSYKIGFIPLLRDAYEIKDCKVDNPIFAYFNYNRDKDASNIGDTLPRPGKPEYASSLVVNRFWRGNRVPIFWHD